MRNYGSKPHKSMGSRRGKLSKKDEYLGAMGVASRHQANQSKGVCKKKIDWVTVMAVIAFAASIIFTIIMAIVVAIK